MYFTINTLTNLKIYLQTLLQCLHQKKNKLLFSAAAICLYSQYLQNMKIQALIQKPPPPQSPSTSFTFATPISPPPATPTDLVKSFIEFALSSQASPHSETHQPKVHSKRKVFRPVRFQKGSNVNMQLSFSPLPKRRVILQLSKPKSRLFDDVPFPRNMRSFL